MRIDERRLNPNGLVVGLKSGELGNFLNAVFDKCNGKFVIISGKLLHHLKLDVAFI